MRAQTFRTLYIRSRRRLRGSPHCLGFVKLCHGYAAVRLTLPDGRWRCRGWRLLLLEKMLAETGCLNGFATWGWKMFIATPWGMSSLSMVAAESTALR